jgi:hypothetical protein
VKHSFKKDIGRHHCNTQPQYFTHIFWMLICKKLPPEVSDDTVSWLTTTPIPCMNGDVLLGLAEESDFGEIELDIGGDLFKFTEAELAPLAGEMAANYSR